VLVRVLAGRQAAIGLGGRRPRVGVVAPDHGVQLGVALIDGGEAGLEQLDRRELAATQPLGQLEGRRGGAERSHRPTLPR
jgi:hypothetical protein